MVYLCMGIFVQSQPPDFAACSPTPTQFESGLVPARRSKRIGIMNACSKRTQHIASHESFPTMFQPCLKTSVSHADDTSE